MSGPGNPPNATLYIRNLDDTIKIPALINDLRETFQEFGEIVDIVAKKNLKAKGQAFVVFDSVETAELAKDTLEGFELHGREISVDFAKTRSDATVRREDGEKEYEEHKKKRLAEKERKQAAEAAAARKAAKRDAPTDASDSNRPTKSAKSALNNATAALTGATSSAAAASSSAGAVPDEFLPPNKTLVLRDLPETFDKARLTEMFAPFAGFKEVRMVPRMKIAFAEYKDVDAAVVAKEATNGKVIEGAMIRVTYQKQ